MKTKLLRKIRKRYEILKITALPYNPSSKQKRNKERCGLPYYLLINKNVDDFSFRNELGNANKKFNYLKYNLLIDWIRKDYKEIVRPKRLEFEKVWHNQSKNKKYYSDDMFQIMNAH